MPKVEEKDGARRRWTSRTCACGWASFGASTGRSRSKNLAGRLCLSPKYGGEHIAKWESGKAPVSGTAEVAIRMMLKGAKPHTMDDVIVPGYPRGEVRV
jgi:hypothetical protein